MPTMSARAQVLGSPVSRMIRAESPGVRSPVLVTHIRQPTSSTDAPSLFRQPCRAAEPMATPVSRCLARSSPWLSGRGLPVSGSTGGRVRWRRSIALLVKSDRIRGSEMP
ncbi:hypothetical protein SGRIM128S_02635 [Streptomyces griseomycini]